MDPPRSRSHLCTLKYVLVAVIPFEDMPSLDLNPGSVDKHADEG